MSHSTETGLDDRCQQAMALRQEGQYDEARRLLDGILAEDPAHLQARLELGLVLLFTGEFDLGTASIEQVVRERPEWYDARVHLAKSYAMLGRSEDACREFLRVVRDAPADSTPHLESKKQLTYFSADLISAARARLS